VHGGSNVDIINEIEMIVMVDARCKSTVGIETVVDATRSSVLDVCVCACV